MPLCGVIMCFFDPVYSVGYVYDIVSSSSQSFKTVLIPGPLPNGDSSFRISFSGQVFDLNAGQEFDISAVVSGGVKRFEIFGIDLAEQVEADNPLGFVTGLTFGGELLSDFFFDMYPILAGCPVSTGADTCLIDSIANQNLGVDALDGTDTLQLGGANPFSFDVAKIGSIYRNFEVFEKIDGANVTLTGTATVAANWDVFAGTLTASGGNAIFNASGVNVRSGATFAVAASETIGRLSGAGALTLAAGQTLTTGDGADTSFTGTTSGAGGLPKAGAGKFSTLSLGHTGLTTVAGGELNANGTIAGSVQINAGATLSGANTIAGNLTNLGTLKSGNSPGSTIVGGNYVGGGLMAVEVVFNSAGAPVNGTTHDYLQVGGNVTGTTQLSIIPFAPSTAPTATAGNGIELVRVGGTVAANAFTLAGPVIQGGFEYLLKYLPDYAATTDGFFLQSAARQELALNAAMLSAGRDTLRACARSSSGHPGLDGAKGRAWAAGQVGNLDAKGSNALEIDADHDCHGGGADFALTPALQLGLSGGYGSTQADVTISQGRATLDGDGSVIEARAAYVAGGFYASASAGYASTDWDIVNAGGGRLQATVDGMVGSLETGYRIAFDEPSTLSLSAGLNYDGSTCGDSCLLAGVSEDPSNWTAKVGARFDTSLNDGKIKPFLAIGLSDDLDHGQSVTLGNAVSVSDTASMLFDVGAGLDAQVASNVSIFAKGGYTRGFDTQAEGYQATAGSKVSW